MNIRRKILEIASEECMRSNVKRAKMAALVLTNDLNGVDVKTHNTKVYGQKRFTIHAEERLVAKCRYSFDTILVCRLKKIGFGNSKPCEKCMKILKEAGVSTVIYFNDGWQKLRI